MTDERDDWDENFDGIPEPPEDLTIEEGVGWRYGYRAAIRDLADREAQQ